MPYSLIYAYNYCKRTNQKLKEVFMCTYVNPTEEDKKVFALHVLIWCIIGALLVCIIAEAIKATNSAVTSTSDNSSTVQQGAE